MHLECQLHDQLPRSSDQGSQRCFRSRQGHDGYDSWLHQRPAVRRYDPQRPRLLGCSAEHDGVTVGLATASADSDSMWQVGIDILPDYRNRGIGKALVSQLTEALFKIRKLPYYSTGISNISSRRIAISVGYRPAWVEIFSQERAEVYLREPRSC